jgi:hypothetical protein
MAISEFFLAISDDFGVFFFIRILCMSCTLDFFFSFCCQVVKICPKESVVSIYIYIYKKGLKGSKRV